MLEEEIYRKLSHTRKYSHIRSDSTSLSLYTSQVQGNEIHVASTGSEEITVQFKRDIIFTVNVEEARSKYEITTDPVTAILLNSITSHVGVFHHSNTTC